jgi:hypothetical protein
MRQATGQVRRLSFHVNYVDYRGIFTKVVARKAASPKALRPLPARSRRNGNMLVTPENDMLGRPVRLIVRLHVTT